MPDSHIILFPSVGVYHSCREIRSLVGLRLDSNSVMCNDIWIQLTFNSNGDLEGKDELIEELRVMTRICPLSYSCHTCHTLVIHRVDEMELEYEDFNWIKHLET